MQGQYQPRAPGIAAGQSNRDTLGTYFDYQGILRTARPKELRPNYVYQNGLWVQQGFLREAQATNLVCQSVFNIPTSASASVATETDTRFPGILGATISLSNINPTDWGGTLYWTVTPNTGVMTASLFLRINSYVTSGDAFLYISLNAGTNTVITDNAGHILNGVPLGGGWSKLVIPNISSTDRRFVIGYYANSNASLSASFTVFLPQLESGASATSPIVTTTAQVTRASDT